MEQASRGYKHTAQTKPHSARAIEAYHPSCPASKLLPNQNDLINKPSPSHSSLVVVRLSQVVAL
jgi:hypothetical protein